MLDSTHLALAYLLQSGYTHLDIKGILSNTTLSPEKVWEDTKKGENTLELSDDRIGRIREKMEKVDEEKIQKYLTEKNIEIISINDALYPERLKSI
jgi:predicted Rossmann fold nucleotide-binding protein DprA/Smf involved in DNA uptake